MVIHRWDDTSVWWWAVQSQAFSSDGDADRRQTRELQRAAGGILEWHMGYRWHANTVSLARISHEPLGWTAQLLKDSTTDEEGWDIYLFKGPAVEKVWDKVGLQQQQKVQPATFDNFLASLHHLYLPSSYYHSVYLIFGDLSGDLSTVSFFPPSFLGSQGQQKQQSEINQERIERTWGSFLGFGTHLPWSDPWIRGHGLAAPSKLLHVLNRLS